MKCGGSLLVVEDIEVSRKFYEDIFGQHVVMDFGENIAFSGGFSLQTKESWMAFIERTEKDILKKSNNMELYFEVEDIDAFMECLKDFPDIEKVHSLKEHDWGQRVIRIYDPDKHIVEVGEDMAVVVKRYIRQGLTVGEISKKTMAPVPYIQELMK